MVTSFPTWWFLCAAVLPLMYGQEDLTVIFAHTNDMHAHFEETSEYTSRCKFNETHSVKNGGRISRCCGGASRLSAFLKKLRDYSDGNSLIVDIGDVYQGTAMFNNHHWRVVADVMNLLPYDVMTLGNHEFDEDVKGLLPFLRSVKIPVVCTNVNATAEPDLAPLIRRSVVQQLNNVSVGIVGYLGTQTVPRKRLGNVILEDEIKSLKEEVALLKKRAINIIVALGHAPFSTDLLVARAIPEIDIVFGGHDHFLFYTGNPPSLEPAMAPYPLVVTHDNGDRALVVQAGAFGKYVGALNVTFNVEGGITGWSGAPRFLDPTMPQDEEILSALKPFREKLDEAGYSEVLGTSRVLLDGPLRCAFHECNLGNLAADAILHAVLNNDTIFNMSRHAFRRSAPVIDEDNQWESADDHIEQGWAFVAIAIINGGAVRSVIEPGEITREDLTDALPFKDEVVLLELPGQQLLDALEQSVKLFSSLNPSSGSMFQVSGLRVSIDLTQPPGSRIREVEVRCADCLVPKYESLKPKALYRVATSDYVADVDDRFPALREPGIKRLLTSLDLTDSIETYIRARSPVTMGIEGRIKVESGSSSLV